MTAQATMCKVLGYDAFGPSEAKAFLTMAGVGWQADPVVAAKIVELWFSQAPREPRHPRSWAVALLQEAHTAVHQSGKPNAESFILSSLYRLLKNTQDPAATPNDTGLSELNDVHIDSPDAQFWGTRRHSQGAHRHHPSSPSTAADQDKAITPAPLMPLDSRF